MQGPTLSCGLWRHSVTPGVAARKVAKRVGEPEPTAFTAGLLHDVGKLVFASVEGQKYGALMKLAQTAGLSTSKVEAALLGVDHAAVGARLLARWELPDNISVAVAMHNGSNGSGEPPDRLAAIAQMASALADQLNAQAPGTKGLPDSVAPAMNVLGLTAEDLPALVAEIKEGLEKVEGLSAVYFDAAI